MPGFQKVNQFTSHQFGSYILNLAKPDKAQLWRFYSVPPLRPSLITTKTAKRVVIFHTHYNFFLQLQRFFQQFYIWTTIFAKIFSEKSFENLCSVRGPLCWAAFYLLQHHQENTLSYPMLAWRARGPVISPVHDDEGRDRDIYQSALQSRIPVQWRPAVLEKNQYIVIVQGKE